MCVCVCQTPDFLLFRAPRKVPDSGVIEFLPLWLPENFPPLGHPPLAQHVSKGACDNIYIRCRRRCYFPFHFFGECEKCRRRSRTWGISHTPFFLYAFSNSFNYRKNCKIKFPLFFTNVCVSLTFPLCFAKVVLWEHFLLILRHFSFFVRQLSFFIQNCNVQKHCSSRFPFSLNTGFSFGTFHSKVFPAKNIQMSDLSLLFWFTQRRQFPFSKPIAMCDLLRNSLFLPL